MALVIADRVKETTTTTGTGTINLAGASSGFQTFASGVGNSNTTYYTIEDANGSWEIGIGTVTDSSPDTLARTTVLATSNGDTTKITLSSGTHTVFGTYAAGKAVYLDASGVLSHSIVDADISGSASIANSKLANSSVNFGGVSLSLGGSDTTPAFDLSDATNYPTSSLSGTITNTQLAGSITNAKLANDSVSFGGITVALGASDATPAFDLSDATNYPTSSLSGTITNTQLAGSIANAKLANSSITVAAGSGSTAISLGGTITFAGTSNEVEVSESAGTITIGLPSTITANVTGNVSGTSATVTGATQASITSAANLETIGTITTGVWQATDVAVAHGGTGASTASAARTNLGVAIGSDVQAYDADLAAIAGLSSADGNFIVGSASGWVAESGATARTSLGVDAAGTDNSTDVTLAGTPDYITISGQEITRNAIDLTADVTGTLPVGKGGTGLTSIATLLNSNVTPTSLGLVIGTNVQAYDAQLATLAGLTADQVAGLEDLATLEAPASDGQFIVATGAGAFAYESGATARTSLGLGDIATQAHDSVDIDGGNIDGATIATSDITVGSSKTLDVSAGTLTTSAAQNLAIVQGAASNIDIGAYELRAQTLNSDVSTGTAPLTVSSTTKVANLNADKLDDQEGSYYLDFSNFVIDDDEIPIAKLANSSITVSDSESTPNTTAIALGGTLTFAGTANETTVIESGGTITIGLPNNVTIAGTLTVDSVGITAVQTSAESFANNDTSIMTSAAIEDKILSYSYSDTTGTVTSVAITGTDGIQVDSGSPVTSSGTITLGLSGIANDKLANSSVSFGGVSVALGASDDTPAFDLADATNYPTSSLSGTITNAQLAGSIANAKLSNSSITVSDGSSTTAVSLGGTITFSGTANEVEVGESSGTITIGLPSSITANVTGNLTGDVTGNADTATVATTVTITDNENENENNAIIFTAGGDVDGGNIGLESDGDLTYNPSTGTVKTTNLLVGDGGNIGSASDADAISISSGGTVSLSQGLVTKLTTNHTATGSDPNMVLTLNLATSNYFRVQLGAGEDITAVNFTNPTVGQRFLIRFEQPSSGTKATVVWTDLDAPDGTNTILYWPGGTAPTLTETNSSADLIGFVCVANPAGSTMAFDGFIVGQDIR